MKFVWQFYYVTFFTICQILSVVLYKKLPSRKRVKITISFLLTSTAFADKNATLVTQIEKKLRHTSFERCRIKGLAFVTCRRL